MNAPLAPHRVVEIDELAHAKMRLELARSRFDAANHMSGWSEAADKAWNAADDELSAARADYRRILSARAGEDAEEIERSLAL